MPTSLSVVASILALFWALLGTSCLQIVPEADRGEAHSFKGTGPTTTAEPTGETREPLPLVGSFGADYFSFVSIVEDDGADEAGGWQEAKASLPFAQLLPPRTWHCSMTVGMPLRSQLRGSISPSNAATMSGLVATAAARS